MFVRTKDVVYKVLNVKTYFDKKSYIVGQGMIILEYNVIKQADTIEELCDEFVIVRNGERPTILINYDNLSLLKARVVKDNQKVYGAIWTDKGLIYVAKMNDKGELELI